MELTETDLPVLLVFSQNPTPEQLAALQGEDKIHAEVLLDKEQSAFGDYNVVVLPTVVVIDKSGRISLISSGYSLFFADLVEDAVLLATGRITQEQFDSSRFAGQENAVSDTPERRARRLTGLAEQLMRRNYWELALQRLREVMTVDSTYLPAEIDMARCFVRMNLLPEAEHQLQEVLEADARHLEANLIMAHVEILRGGEEIQVAEDRLERILAATPTHPEAHYLLGLAYEAQGQKDLALSHYKKAAQYLLETSSL
jgi:tetratricopeptide (TPR) repeat protein